MPLVWIGGAGGEVVVTQGVGSVQAISVAKEREASQLLPHGPPWTRRPDSTLQKLVRGLSREFARVDFALAQLEREALPDTADESLSAWEAFAGLPGACEDPPEDLQGRRDAVVAKLFRSRGPLDIRRATEIAESLGYTVVTSGSSASGHLYSPFKCGSKCGESLAGVAGGWNYAYLLTVSGSSANDGILRCIIADAAHLGYLVVVEILP